MIWRPGSEWKPLPGSGSAGFAFSRDGKRLLTSGEANTVRIWDAAAARELARLYYRDKSISIVAVAFSPDEKQIYAIGDNWAVYHFVVPLDDLEAEARKLVIDAKGAVTDEDCGTYLHQRPCPKQLRRTPDLLASELSRSSNKRKVQDDELSTVSQSLLQKSPRSSKRP
jgi:hypothetical protein